VWGVYGAEQMREVRGVYGELRNRCKERKSCGAQMENCKNCKN
jgi:hypothetical protein